MKEWNFRARGVQSFYDHQSRLAKILPASPYLMTYISVTNQFQTVRAKFSPFAIPAPIKFENNVIVKKCFSQLTLAIQSLHACGLVHNDVRWDNVVLQTNGNFLLVDYDLMSVCDATRKVPGVFGLNPDSHAPNIKRDHGPEVDIWGLGYLMATTIVSPQAFQAVIRSFGSEIMEESQRAPNKCGDLLQRIMRFCESVN